MRQKIGILGGTFNPIHNGHLTIARCALDQFALDSVLFLPTGHTAYKDFAGTDMSLHRCRMVELAVEDEPRFTVCYDEIESETVSYTYQTLARMQEAYPDAQLFFLLGGDSLRDFPTWRHPEIICREAVILVAARTAGDNGEDAADSGIPGLSVDATDRQIAEMSARYQGDFRRIDTPLVDISSTEIRRMVYEHLDIRDMVPPAVADYIYKNQLYRKAADKGQI